MAEMQKTEAYSSQSRDPQHQQSHSQNLEVQRSSSPAMQPRDARSLYNMSISNPFAVMRRLMEDIEQRLFEGFSGSQSRDPIQGLFERTTWSPDLEVFTRGDNLIVRADLPGLQPNDLKVHLEDGVLCIEGERRTEQTNEKEGLWHSERSYGKFVRKLTVPPEVRDSDINASFNNGVLEISMPLPKRRGRSIPINQKASHPSGGASSSTSAGNDSNKQSAPAT